MSRRAQPTAANTPGILTTIPADLQAEALNRLWDGQLVTTITRTMKLVAAEVCAIGEAAGLEYVNYNQPMHPKPPAATPIRGTVVTVNGPDEDDSWQDSGWQDRALCAETDPEAFFPEKGGSTREAKRTCRACEVRAECLEYALAHDERFGIWGGLSERERRRLKKAA